jgi:hypothetical protein
MPNPALPNARFQALLPILRAGVVLATLGLAAWAGTMV